jgi:hypothetical protein
MGVCAAYDYNIPFLFWCVHIQLEKHSVEEHTPFEEDIFEI